MCDLTHLCVLYIGQSGTGFAPHVFSQVFQVDPKDATDSGANPGDGPPEVPLAVGLPLRPSASSVARRFSSVAERQRRLSHPLNQPLTTDTTTPRCPERMPNQQELPET